MKIVPEKKYPEMYRVQWPDGSLSDDFYNKNRAKEYMRRKEVIELKPGKSCQCVGVGV